MRSGEGEATIREPTEQELARIVDIGGGQEAMPYGRALAWVNHLISTGELGRAEAVLHCLTRMFPDDLIPRAQLLHIRVNRRDHAEVVAIADAIRRHVMHDSTIVALCIRGYRQAGSIEKALALATEAGRRFSDSTVIQHEIGLCFTGCGRKAEAVAAFGRAIALSPAFIPAHLARASLLRGQTDVDQVEAMAALARQPGLDDEQRAMLNFAFAWTCYGVDPDRHFEYLHRANAVIARLRPWDEDGERERLARVRELFSAESVDRMASAGIDDLAPVFIVGMPRSGTSLFEQILAAHDDVTACGETSGIERAIEEIAERAGTSAPIWCWRNAGCIEQHFASIDQAYRKHLSFFDINTPVFTDKSLGNEWWCGVILTMYPRARIVQCLRHPLDSCLSMYQIHFGAGQAFSYNLRSIAQYFRIYSELMAHWTGLFPGRILTMRYEDLIEAQRDNTARMLTFCGLSWQEQCMEFHRVERLARTASDFQIKQPLYRSGMNRWRPYARHLNEVADILSIKLDD